MKEIIEFGLEKHWDYLTGLASTLWYIGFGLAKYWDYLTGLEMILYVGISPEKYLNYLTGFGLTLSVYGILELDFRNSALGLPNWTWIDFIKHWIWIN